MNNEYDFTIKVKNCPFCGTPPEKKVRLFYDGVLKPSLFCPNCKFPLQGQEIVSDATMEEVIIAIAKVVNKWNERGEKLSED